MHHWLSQSRLDRAFRVAVTLKALDGCFEAAGGLALLVVPLARIKGIVADLALREIQADHHAFIAQFVLWLDGRVSPAAGVFVVLYLVGHGLVKVLLAGALLRRWWQVYPVAIGFLLAFILYQSYLVGYNHSWLLAIFTVLDGLVAWLTFLEWRRHKEMAR